MVDVNAQNKTISVNVSSSGVSSSVNASGDTTMYYSKKAREWAISNRIVDGVDYSSKYYAGRANQSALNAQSFAQSAQDSYEQFQDSVDGVLSNIDSSVQGAIEDINNAKTDIITDIEFVADGEKQEIEDLIDSGKEELKESIGDIKILTTLEIGDIGFTQMAIDEAKGKRRILNGQLIIQDQYVQLANIIKNSVALNPDLACTEAEWQTAVTMSTFGICYKFVIDDNAGTIRLPKYPDYFIGGVNSIAPVVGNGIALGMTDGTNYGGTISFSYTSSSGQDVAFRNGAYGLNIGESGNIASPSDSNTKVLGITEDPTKSGIEAQIKQEQIKGTYFIQVATGAETEDNIVNTLELNNPFILLEPKYFENEIYNISWLLASGTYNGSNAVHPSAYQALLVENNAEVAIGSTVTLPIGTEYTKRGLSVKLSTDNDITDNDFVVNTSDETFRLKINTDNTQGLLYFYVGETVQNANLINAGRIEEKLADISSELVNKVNDLQKSYITETYVNGTSWYRIWSDGWCEQGGLVSNRDAIKTIQLLVAYINTNYSIYATSRYPVGDSTLYQPHVDSQTTTSFQCATFGERGNTINTSGAPVYWKTCGYIR
jgi:hypothetical protein